MIRHCAHPTCRTSLSDEDTVYCAHDVPFCHQCDWVDGCDDCHIDLLKARADAAWNAEPDRAWIDPRRQGDVDSAAENRKTEREYAHHLLIDREEAC